jgi:hypothetical protein
MAAMQLHEAAQRCEEAAHYLSLAPPRARAWAEQMVEGIRMAEPSGGSSARRRDVPGEGTPPAEGQRDDDQKGPKEKKSGDGAGAGDEARPEDSSAPSPDQPDSFEPVARGILDRLPVRNFATVEIAGSRQTSRPHQGSPECVRAELTQGKVRVTDGTHAEWRVLASNG